jgi:bacterial/archaeal transporter family protein
MELATITFLLLAIAGWGMAGFLDKLSLKFVDPNGAFLLRSLFMVCIFTPLVLWKSAATKQALFSGKLGPLTVLASVIVTMVGVFFYLKALSGGAATKIVPLSSTYPFITAVLAILFLGESLTLNKLIGTLLLSGGIYFISK